jgi:hypothetical protein
MPMSLEGYFCRGTNYEAELAFFGVKIFLHIFIFCFFFFAFFAFFFLTGWQGQTVPLGTTNKTPQEID